MHYTNKGHALGHVRPLDESVWALVFRCFGQAISGAQKGRPNKAEFVLSDLAVYPPCTRAQVTDTIRGWLGVYDDQELLAQVEAVVAQALETLADAPPATPPPPPAAPKDAN
jgi:hypothetical protein